MKSPRAPRALELEYNTTYCTGSNTEPRGLSVAPWTPHRRITHARPVFAVDWAFALHLPRPVATRGPWNPLPSFARHSRVPNRHRTMDSLDDDGPPPPEKKPRSEKQKAAAARNFAKLQKKRKNSGIGRPKKRSSYDTAGVAASLGVAANKQAIRSALIL